MRAARTFLTICGVVAVMAFLAPSLHADEYTKTTHLTFSAPVQLPGLTLPAGTYTFKLADPESGRRTLQVWDKDEGKLLTTLLTIPDQRLEPSSEPVVLFSEQPAGAPRAIRAWFYPGERYGQEFVYPREQAMQIAKANDTTVMAYRGDTSNDLDAAAMHKADVGRVDAQGQAVEAGAAAPSASASAEPAAPSQPAASRDPEPAPAQSASSAAGSTPSANRTESSAPAPVGTSGSADNSASAAGAQQSQSSTPRELPATASPLGLLGLLSAMSIAGAAGVRRLRRGYVQK